MDGSSNEAVATNLHDDESTNAKVVAKEAAKKDSPSAKVKPILRALMSLQEYRDQVVSASVIFSVDNIKLYVKKYGVRHIEHKVHLDCPCCDKDNISLEPYTLMGEHLKWKHEVTHITCPGSNCGDEKEIPVYKFRTHLEKFHLNVPCPICNKVTSALQIMEHIAIYHSQKNLVSSQSLLKPKAVSPNKRSANSSKDPKKMFTYEILLNGQLLIVDSIHFYVISGVAFVDCPICVNKSLALHLLPDHIKDHHRIERIQCPASENICGQTISWHKLLPHIVSQHGRLPCMFCDKIYKVNEMHHHMTQICEMSYYQVSKGNSDTMPIPPPVQPTAISLDNGNSNSTVYKSWSEMTSAKRREARVNAGKNTCPFCPALVHSVDRHVRKVHIGENGTLKNTKAKPPKPAVISATSEKEVELDYEDFDDLAEAEVVDEFIV